MPFIHFFDIFLFVAELEDPKIGTSGKGLSNIEFVCLQIHSFWLGPKICFGVKKLRTTPVGMKVKINIRFHVIVELPAK